MSTRLGTLTLDLITRVAGFIDPIREAERESERSFGKMREHVNTYGLAIGGLAVSVTAGLAAMAVQTASNAAELEKFAFRSNTTTQEFQKMAVGAQALGIESETLSSMLKDFNEKLGEVVAVGGGGAVDFFEKIAVKTEGSAEAAAKLILQMQKLSGPEALQLYYNKLEEAGVPQQQMSFYLESMASDLTDLIPLLADGGRGFKLYGELAEEAGLIMSDKTREAALLLKDQVYMLDLQMQGAKNQLMTAVIPAFLSIADAFFSGSEQGAQFEGVARGVANTLKTVASIAIGAATAFNLVGKSFGALAAIGANIVGEMDWYEMNPIGLAKVAYETRAQNAEIFNAFKTDAAATIADADRRLNALWNDNASKKAKDLRNIRELSNQSTGNAEGLKELTEKQNESAKAAKNNSNAQRELTKRLEEQKRIIYDYANLSDQMQLDLNDEIARIRSSYIANADDYIAVAKARHDALKKLSDLQFAYEVGEHRFTEKQKLDYSMTIKLQEVEADKKLTDDQKKTKIQAIKELHKIESSQIKISQDMQILEAKKGWLSASEYAREYYALVREEILNTSSYSPEVKDILIKKSYQDQGIDENADRDAAWNDYKDRFGLNDNPYQQDIDLLSEAKKQMLITEEQYQQQRLELQHAYGSEYASSFASLMMGLVDESSSAYGTLGGIQKASALYSVAMSNKVAIAKAWESAAFPYNLPAVAMATVETGLLQAAVQALTPMSGYADGGFTGYGGKYDVAGVVHKGEGVLNQEEIAAIGGPSGFYALRAAIKNGYAEGGFVDSPKMLNVTPKIQSYVDEAKAMQQQQAMQSLQINNILDPAIVGDFMGTPAGTKVFTNFIKSNRSSLKALLK